MSIMRRASIREPTATMKAAYAICMFANRSCECALRQGSPCDTINQAARAVIDAAKSDLQARSAKSRGPV